jgi:hypothetical protein
LCPKRGARQAIHDLEERYLGCKQELSQAVNDNLELDDT